MANDPYHLSKRSSLRCGGRQGSGPASRRAAHVLDSSPRSGWFAYTGSGAPPWNKGWSDQPTPAVRRITNYLVSILNQDLTERL